MEYFLIVIISMVIGFIISMAALNSLISIIKRQQEALGFYAKENNYYTDDRGNRSDSIGYNVDLITEDMGITARATLAATKEELEKLGLGDV